MLARDIRRVVLVVGPCFLLFYTALRCLEFRDSASGLTSWFDHVFSPTWKQADELEPHSRPAPSVPQELSPPAAAAPPPDATEQEEEEEDQSHHEIFSVSTLDKKFFPVVFGNEETINPNIIPHPTLDNTFIIVAQKRKPEQDITAASTEIACYGVFTPAGLSCLDAPVDLPIAATNGDKRCPPEVEALDLNVGPHDARVFHGPKQPLVVYGSNSRITCFGQFVQSLRALGTWGFDDDDDDDKQPSDDGGGLGGNFGVGTELQRPPPWGAVEKNWFLFWDEAGDVYVHHDVAPRRVFAKLGPDGSVGPDLAPLATGDEACLGRYMPKLPPSLESIHQATNSLSITLCRRSDAGGAACERSSDNTFVFAIIQHKTFYRFHSEYEPYVVVFRQQAPFEVFAVSRRPIWIHGRERREGAGSDMLYVTSMSWRDKEKRYHGYMDDTLFVSFGVEDRSSGAIDVLAEDLLADLGACLGA